MKHFFSDERSLFATVRPGSPFVRLFHNHREAEFFRRDNRFRVTARDEAGEIPCHLANPGRLTEILLPGTRLILERRVSGSTSALRKTEWTAVGAYHNGEVVPLFSARMNAAAENLVLPVLFPGAQGLVREYRIGPSRFDFYLRDGYGFEHLVEIKACSLVEYGTAMFPDAPSGRALRHLEELAELSENGYRTHVLFILTHGTAQRFVPNPHTDPSFAAAMLRLSGKVAIHAAQIRVRADGTASLAGLNVPVDLSHGRLAEENRGSYLILMELDRPFRTDIGALGPRDFPPGWYVYAGSAQKGLSQRTARHLRRVRKARHWHLDYLTPAAASLKALPIASYRNLECELAAALRETGGIGIDRFGSSDCGCISHLYHFTGPPLEDPIFVDLLLRFRHREALR
jgi:sugar fermentation stimulation protein A